MEVLLAVTEEMAANENLPDSVRAKFEGLGRPEFDAFQLADAPHLVDGLEQGALQPEGAVPSCRVRELRLHPRP